MRELGESVIELENRCARLEAVVAGDSKKNTDLAKASESGRRSPKKKSIEKCFGKFCCVTTYDSNTNWVQGDNCLGWYHTFCEGMSP